MYFQSNSSSNSEDDDSLPTHHFSTYNLNIPDQVCLWRLTPRPDWSDQVISGFFFFSLILFELGIFLKLYEILVLIAYESQESLHYPYTHDMGLEAGKPVLGGLHLQQRCRPACTSMQSDQHLCYSLVESIISRLAQEKI